jgi:hypothetical protein
VRTTGSAVGWDQYRALNSISWRFHSLKGFEACLQLLNLCFLAFENRSVWGVADLCFTEMLQFRQSHSQSRETELLTANPATIIA